MSKIQYGFNPLVDSRTRVLILGSFPSVMSLKSKGYYAHPRNQFWRILSDLLDVDLAGLSYKQRVCIVMGRGIGIWDVIRSCRRKGSSDTAIKGEQLNDIGKLLDKYPGIEFIILNGGKAAELFAKCGNIDRRHKIVPSSSPANAIRYEVKKKKWALALRPKKI